MFGGFGASRPRDSATKTSSSSTGSALLKRRSKPIVDDAFELIAFPHSEPATWPGKTSTPSGSSSRRRSEWKRPSAPSFAPTARSGRAASPTKSESPVRTSHGSSARERSTTARQVCSGRCPGVWIARRTTSPSSSSSAVAQRVVRRTRPRRRDGSRSGRRARARAGRARRGDRRACASRRRGRSRRRASRLPRAPARSRTEDRRPPRCRRPRRRPGTTRSRGRRPGTAGRARAVTLSGAPASRARSEHRRGDARRPARRRPTTPSHGNGRLRGSPPGARRSTLPSTSTDSPSAKTARRTSSKLAGGRGGPTRTRTLQTRLAADHSPAAARRGP